ncbi:hypothetical protein HGB07_00460 [Candidatus Roizmanbacteria bacterium]|nr:hypothetical protein [Candidatus Roizmanbacteria bacterium]
MGNLECAVLHEGHKVASNGRTDFIEDRQGRTYLSLGQMVHSWAFLRLKHSMVQDESQREQSPNRRAVTRAICTDDVTQMAVEKGMPVEVVLPLNLIDGNRQGSLVVLGENIHDSFASETDQLELEQVNDYWNTEISLTNPYERLEALNKQGYHLSKNLTTNDAVALAEIWEPFGWDKAGVEAFIRSYENDPDKWVSVIRDDQNKIISGCMAERVHFKGLEMVETTEFGTHPDHRGHGACTVALYSLISQVMTDTQYNPANGNTPLIMAEFNMTARSDVVGRHVGMEVPKYSTNNVRVGQILQRNVSVFDGKPENTIRLEDLPEEVRETYRASYGNDYSKWRNFVVGLLPETSIDNYYQPDQVQKVLSQYDIK